MVSAELTREQILAMPAGPEMDALVAERVFGMVWQGGNPIPHYDGRRPWPPPYSGDIAAAWEVFEKVNGRSWDLGWRRFEHVRGFRWEGWVIQDGTEYDFLEVASGETAPLAICRAALLTRLEDSP